MNKTIKKYLPYTLAGIAFYLLFLKNTTKAPVTSSVIKEYVQKLMMYATNIMAEYGIPPIVYITQSALESGFGTSLLARQANNLFGIKATTAWINDGKPVYIAPTKEYFAFIPYTSTEKFRRYSSWEESLNDWAQLISTASRYAESYKWAINEDIINFAKAIGSSGYATDPKYTEKILNFAKLVQGELA